MNEPVTVGQIYTGDEYAERHPTYHVEASPWKAQQILTMLHKHDFPLRTVCDVGCGAGEILRQLQLALPDDVVFTGYEVSPRAFQLCQSRANTRLHFYCQDLLAVEVDPYDLLLCIDVFEHVEDYLGFLRGLRPKARYKLFHIPLDMSAQTVLRREPILRVRQQVGHLHYFMKDTALAALQDTGYSIVDWMYTPSSVERAQHAKARLLRWPRRALAAFAPDVATRLLGGYSLLVLAQ